MVTSSHVVSPWRWPKYYPESWLQEVSEKDTHYTVELRHPNGMFKTQSELFPISYHHPTKDLAVLHFMSEESMINTLVSNGLEILEFSTDEEFASNSVSLLIK